MRGDLGTLNKLSSSINKSDLEEAQSLRKQLFPSANEDGKIDSLEIHWGFWALFAGAALVGASLSLYYYGYFDKFLPSAGGSGDGPDFFPLQGTPRQGDTDLELLPVDSTSINKLSDIGNSSSSSSSDSSGSLTPTWGNSKTREEYNSYFAKSAQETISKPALAAINKAELETFDTNWTKKTDGVIDSNNVPNVPNTSASGKPGSLTDTSSFIGNKAKGKLSEDGPFLSRFANSKPRK